MTTAIATGRTLRPLRHLSWRSTAAGNVALFVPGGLVAIVLSLLDGRPVAAAIVAVVILLAAALIVVPALRIRTRLDADGITSFRSGPAHIARKDVTRAVVRTIYNGDGMSTTRHLFLLDDEEHAVHRMSSRWWTDEQLLAVAHHFAVPLDAQPHPVHLAEVRRTSPEHLSWTERHRVLAIAALIAAGFLLCLAFAWLTTSAI
jgi:hypothetical protein